MEHTAAASAYEAGMTAFNAGDYLRALLHLEPIQDGVSVRATLARFYVGQAHLRLGIQQFQKSRFAAAAAHFRRAADHNPGGGGLCRYLATCFVALGRWDNATAQLERAVREDPGEVGARVRLALALWKQGRIDRAEQTLREGLAASPSEPELLYQLATLAASEDRLEEAVALLQDCLRARPDLAAAHKRLAQCFGVLGRFNEAAEHLAIAQRLDPNDALVGYQLSLLADRTEGAASRPAAWRPPDPVDLNDRRAIERLAAIVREDPDFVDAFLSLPASEVDGNVFAALLEVLRQAIRETPSQADLHHRCSQVLWRLGRVQDALAASEQAVALNPRYIAALIQLALLYQSTDRHLEAIARLREAIRHGGNYADVHYLLGKLHEARGELADARLSYTRALELNRDYTAAREALRALAA